MAGGYDKCVNLVKQAGGQKDGQPLINDAKAKKILDELLAERKVQNKKGLQDPDFEFLDKIQQMAQDQIESATIEKRNYLLTKLKDQEFEAYAKNFPNDFEAYMAYLGGSSKVIDGARNSIDARQKALHAEFFKVGLLNKLEREKLLVYFNDKKYSRDIAIELYELDSLGGNPGKTNNTPAVKIAKIVKQLQDNLIERQNKSGAWIKKLPGYISRQSHDMERVRKATFEEWRDFILPKLDQDKTFKGVPLEKQENMLLEAYRGITTGNHLKAESAQGNPLAKFIGPSSIGRKVSEHRVLHFKSGEDFADYNHKFGTGSTQYSIAKSIESSTYNLALMEKMGPNAEAYNNSLIEKLKDRNRDNTKIHDRLIGNNLNDNLGLSVTPENMWKEVSGETRMVSSLGLAKVGQTLRNLTTLASLGSSFLSQLGDIAIRASRMRGVGRNGFQEVLASAQDLLSPLRGEDYRIAAHSLGIGLEGHTGATIGRFMPDDPLPGVMSDLTSIFFKLNLMEHWNESQKTGVGMTLSSLLGEQSHLSYDDLKFGTKELFNLYSISKADWDTMRSQGLKTVNGNKMVFPDQIENDALRTKFYEYITDMVDQAILTPGARERAIITKGTKAGTYQGELLRFIGQFKMFSISVIAKSLPREVHASGSAVSKVGNIAQLMIGATVLGYMSMSLKDLSKGKKPRPLEDAKTWEAAMLQGGGLGIYGDFLFGEYDRYGAGLLASLAGPTLSKVDPIGRMFSEATKGKLKAAEIFQFAKNNTPFINLFYTRAALDYLFLYGIQEQLTPGFLRRMEKRIMEDNGQEFILPPSQTVGR